MLSKYFKIKTKTRKFDDDLLWSMGEIKDKKVLLYGAGRAFVELNKKYFFTELLNIVAIADKKFEPEECCCCNDCKCEHNIIEETFEGIRAIAPEQILNEDYDVLLITNESPGSVLNYVFNKLEIKDKDVRTVFNEEFVDESQNLNYLYKMNFDKNLPKLLKSLNGKKIMLYGAGEFFRLAKSYFDLSGISAIGIADKKFENHEENAEWEGYKVYSPSEIKDANPDIVLVTNKYYINVIEELYYDVLKGTKIKIKPMLKKSFITLIKEIWK
ncbi:hypothetical protein IJ843_02855 [bacterium]|nr:hypothetical protein [bacterium]